MHETGRRPRKRRSVAAGPALSKRNPRVAALFSSSGPPGAEDIRRLYDTVAPVLVRIAFRITGSSESAEDVVQEAFARLIEKDIPFPTMDDAKFWLIRVVKNGALYFAIR